MEFPLQPYDLLMLAVLALSMLFGAWKGMAWQLAALTGLAAGIVVALQFCEPVAAQINVEAPWNRVIAMMALYLVTSIGVRLIFQFLSGAIDRMQLKEFDRHLGAVFGAVKGVAWCVIITFIAVLLSDAARENILGTRSGYYATVLIHRAVPLLPSEIRDRLGRYIEQYDRRIESPSVPEQPVAVKVHSGVVPILGPITRGDSPKRIPLPRGDLLRAWSAANASQPTWLEKLLSTIFDREPGPPRLPPPPEGMKIELGPCCEYVDPPRTFPLIGPAQLYHAVYRCTFDYGNAREVVHIDYNHLHLVGECDGDPPADN